MSAKVIDRLCTLILASTTRLRLYGGDHRLVGEALGALQDALEELFSEEDVIRLAVRGEEVLCRDERADGTIGAPWGLVRRLGAKGIGYLEFRRGVGREELVAVLSQLAEQEAVGVQAQPHVKIGTAEIDVRPLGIETEALRVREQRGTRTDEPTVEASQLIHVTRRVREHYEVRAKDFKEIALSLICRFSQQDNLFFNLAEVRDHNLFTYLHTCNVASLCIGFSLALGAPGQTAYDLGVAALLHDVGKNFVPEEVLDKPGRLTEEEWNIIRLHPVNGARFLLKQKEASHLSVVVAFEHHMHFDGTGGYPTAAKRPALQSQLVAVADTFDALFGQRSYHRRYDVVEALEILQADAGRIYNPQIVDEFSRYVTLNLDEAGWVV